MKFHRDHILDMCVLNDSMKMDEFHRWPNGPEVGLEDKSLIVASLGANG